MTTQEPVGELDGLWDAYDYASDMLASGVYSVGQLEAARTALITAIEARAVAPWREALEVIERIARDKSAGMTEGLGYTTIVRLTRALLHPNVEVKDV